MRRIFGSLVLVALVVLAGCAQAPGLAPSPSDDGSTTPAPEGSTAATTAPGDASGATADAARDVHPPDPATDVLGWEDGYWYNESLAVNQSDGLNRSERRAVVARTMARVEKLRGLEFTKRVPVSIVSRSKLRADQRNRSSSAALRRFDNVKFEALFLVDRSTDSIDVQQQNAGSSVLGYYSPRKDAIVVVNDGGSLTLDELTLAHELTHALQDQQFNLTTYNRQTRDGANAESGLIEGDAHYVETLYGRHCGGAWSCLQAGSNDSNGGNGEKSGNGGESGSLANVGIYLLKYQPYSDGPAFVQRVRNQGGWAAVNALYADPPASTEQVIHPAKYGTDEPQRPTVTDSHASNWSRIDVSSRSDHASLGEAALFSMFMYPAYESDGRTQLFPARSFFNYGPNGDLQTIDPLNYTSRYSAGWGGDTLVPYVDDRGQTGYVWKLTWDTERDATQFVTGYRALLRFHDARRVSGHPNTWRIPANESFGGAYAVSRRGETVVVVNAPTVSQLSQVRAGAGSPANSTANRTNG